MKIMIKIFLFIAVLYYSYEVYDSGMILLESEIFKQFRKKRKKCFSKDED